MSQLDDIAAMTEAYGQAVESGTMIEPDGVVAVVVPVPTGNLGYGRDLSCFDDLTANMDDIDENSPAAVEEALYRRIITPHGSLAELGEDPDYGRNIVGFLSLDTDSINIMAQQDLLAAECKKDDRVKTCTCVITDMGGGNFDVSLDGELENGLTYNLVRTFSTGTELAQELAK
jgi:hypothetical protein